MHALLQAPCIGHLAIHVKLLVLGNLELLVFAVRQSENHRIRRADEPHFAGNTLYSSNSLRDSSRSNRPLDLHSHFQLVNSYLLSINRNSRTFRYIVEVSKRAV